MAPKYSKEFFSLNTYGMVFIRQLHFAQKLTKQMHKHKIMLYIIIIPKKHAGISTFHC